MDNPLKLLMSFLMPNVQAKTPLVSPVPKSGAIAKNSIPDDLEKRLQKGFSKWGKGTPPPIATKSAQLAQLGKTLPKNLAAFPAALTLRETGGLSNSESGRIANNPIGIMPGGVLAKYPSLDVGILGGGTGGPGGKPQMGLKGVLADPRYKPFLQSQNLADFVRVYSPHLDRKGNEINPPEDKQVQDLIYLMSLFQ